MYTGCIFVGMFIRFNPWDEPQHYARPPGFNWVSRIYGRSPDMPCWRNNGNVRHWLLLSKEQTDEYWIQISWESALRPIYWTAPRDGLLPQMSGKLPETSRRRIMLNEIITHPVSFSPYLPRLQNSYYILINMIFYT